MDFAGTLQERDDILSSLERRSIMVHKALNDLEGITCNKADGALYAFPRIRLSNKAKQVAEAKGVAADEYYCLKVRTRLLSCQAIQKKVLSRKGGATFMFFLACAAERQRAKSIYKVFTGGGAALPRPPPAPRALNAAADQILDESGIVLVPGSGFGQEEGTLHFRTTFLPAEETMHETMKIMAKAHGKFMDEHRD